MLCFLIDSSTVKKIEMKSAFWSSWGKLHHKLICSISFIIIIYSFFLHYKSSYFYVLILFYYYLRADFLIDFTIQFPLLRNICRRFDCKGLFLYRSYLESSSLCAYVPFSDLCLCKQNVPKIQYTKDVLK